MMAMVARIVILLLLGVATPLVACAADLENPQEAIDAGRQGLDQWWSYPWYDAATDSPRRIEIRATQPSRMPNINWSLGENFILIVGWILLAVVLALFAWFLIRAFLDRETGTASQAQKVRQTAATIDRVTSLPFQVKRPDANLLAEAERQYRQGNYSEAIIYLYSHQLVELDKAQFIRLTRGKTNRQYVREAKAASPAGDLLEQTMLLFEKAFFGHHVIGREQFEACWNRLKEFENHLVLVAS